jgi:hypothetical protein
MCEIQRALWLVTARSLGEMVEPLRGRESGAVQVRGDLENLGHSCDGCDSSNGRFPGMLHMERLGTFQMDE